MMKQTLTSNDNNNGTTTSTGTISSSGGMSRAALKKKKNKRKQQQMEVVVDNNNKLDSDKTNVTPESTTTAAAIDAKKRKKNTVVDTITQKNSTKFGRIDDDDLVLDADRGNDDDDDDDENIPMKQPSNDNNVTTESSSSSSSLLAKECQTLYEILLLSSSSDTLPNNNNDDEDDDDNDETGTTTTTTTSNDKQRTLTQMTIEQRAQCALEFLLQPSSISKTSFYTNYHEQLPLFISCRGKNGAAGTVDPQQQQLNHKRRYESLFSISDLRSMIQNNTLYYGTDLNVTRYERSAKDGIHRRITLDKKRKTMNHQNTDMGEYEIVKSEEVWDMYENQQCTIRLLCPQQYNDTIYTLLSLFEHEFHCMVGSNIYCTPPNAAQGFAPHYDDIDAYIVQLEGYKRWKVYKPINKQQRLPRTSSTDYTTQDLMNIEPVLDIVLHPGDMLYMPRGWIHQACTIPSDDNSNNTTNDEAQHSLHLTISTMQQWAWADYLEMLVPEALQATIQSSTTTLLREGLPNGFLSYMGAMYDNRTELLPDVLQSKINKQNNDDKSKPNDSTMNKGFPNKSGDDDDDDGDNVDDDDVLVQQQVLQRQVLQEEFRTQTKRRLMRVVKEAMTMIDAACDQIGKRFLSERLPPALTATERNLTYQSTTMTPQQHKLTPDLMCQMVRPGIARLVLEDEMAIVYHCNDNSRVYQEIPISPIEFEMDDAPAIEQLLTTIPPYWITIQDLIHDTIDDKVSIAQSLYDEGILAIRR